MFDFKKGFSVLEVLVVLAILILLIVIILPSFKNMRDSQLLKTVASDVFSSIDKARSNTLSSLDSSEYGVHFASDEIIIFKGTVFDANDVNNESISIISPASISNIALFGGGSELYFNRLSGAPNKTGTITVSVSSTTKVITISATGFASMN